MSPTDGVRRAVRLPRPLVAPTPIPPRAADGSSGLELVRVLVDGRWLVLGVVALALALAAGYLLVATPSWRAEALLRLEERLPSSSGDPLTAALDTPSAKAEIELLRSRTLLTAAAEQVGLDVAAYPRRVPVVGKLWARAAAGSGLPRPPLGLAAYAWGRERIALGRLEVPDQLVGVPLVLTADEDGGFQLFSRDGATLADGAVGSLVEGSDAAGDPVRVLVSELVARPGTEFLVQKLRISEVVAALQLRYVVEERGTGTGVVALRVEGSDRHRVASTLAAIIDAYLRQNGERTTARAARMVALLDSRLSQLKAAAQRAEGALESWKLKNGTVDVGVETRALLERSIDLGRRISDLHARRSELALRYTDRHPGLGELSGQIEGLEIQQRLIEGKLRTLPTMERQAARLTRDVQAATAMYLHLNERAQQYRVAAAAIAGSATLVDVPAAADEPIAPRAPPVVGLALLAGLAAGVGAAVVRRRMGGAGDPVEVEVATGLSVLGTVPHSSTEASLARVIRRRLEGTRAAALHAVNPDDVAVEDLRTLRTNLAAALRSAKSNVVAIGGPAPGVGKSFVCVNLGLLLASARRRVLLVDADLRRGRLHHEFGLERTPGVAEVVAGGATFDTAVRPSGTDALDVLAAGELPDDPTALLESPRFRELLAEAGKRYDVVLVDTAAILAVTDPALVARHAGLSLLVLRAGEHPVQEIALAVKRLRQGGARVDGAILNDLRPGRHARYRYEYRARAGA